MTTSRKAELRKTLCKDLEAEIEQMIRIAKDAADAVTHEDNKPEGDKDMRSTEASYVARGQAGRVQDLSRSLTMVGGMELIAFRDGTPIETSALVVVEQGQKRTTYFLVPAAGGRRIATDRGEVLTLTTTSPLGEALLGSEAGDDIELQTPQGLRKTRIVSVE